MKIFFKLCFFSLILPFTTASAAVENRALSSYKIDPKAITVSGISSGAFMAVQMQVAYSKTISGAASIAGGVFWCAKGDLNKAKAECMGQPTQASASDQVAEAQRLADTGAIDPLENLQQQKLYLYSSPKDSVVHYSNSDKIENFYTHYMNASDIHREKTIQSAHGFPTLSSGNPCQLGFMPWILNCNYDAAGELLKTMYGELAPRGKFESTHLLKFSQQEFGDAKTPLYKEGWVYVPADCARGDVCKLHVALHGCQMNPEFTQDQFERLAGYNEWAESNHIIVLYPQSAKVDQANPYACWDWYGFTGANYLTQSGSQMMALKKMIEKISSSTANKN